MATMGGLRGRGGEGRWKGRTWPVDDGRDRLQPLQHLDAGLGLPRLGGAGPETVDEALQVLPLFFLLLDVLLLDELLLAPLGLERLVVAAPECQLRLVEMQDVIADGVEQVAVMADDQDGSPGRSRGTRSARACLRDRGSWSVSSSSRRSGRVKSTAASATRIRQPPENSD